MKRGSILAGGSLLMVLAAAMAWGPVRLAVAEKQAMPPEGRTRSTAAQVADVESVLAGDGYLCCVESRMVPETRNHRVQSFDRRLYRLRLGQNKPEQVYRVVGTRDFQPLLGPKGALATRDEYLQHFLFLPGQP